MSILLQIGRTLYGITKLEVLLTHILKLICGRTVDNAPETSSVSVISLVDVLRSRRLPRDLLTEPGDVKREKKKFNFGFL